MDAATSIDFRLVPGVSVPLTACRRPVSHFAPIPICVEFRNYTWMTPENQAEALEFLEGHDLPYQCVDMPPRLQELASSRYRGDVGSGGDPFHDHNADE
jgi:hypothetical protein